MSDKKKQNRINKFSKGAAAAMLCGAFAVSTAFSAVSVHAMENTAQESTPEKNSENIRLIKYRTLKALNELRDLGLTPQVIWNELCGLMDDNSGSGQIISEGSGEDSSGHDLETGEGSLQEKTKDNELQGSTEETASSGGSDILSQITEKAGDTAQEIGKQASEAAKKAGNEAADKAAEEVKKQAGNVIDSFADKMSEAFQNFVDSIFSAGN